MDSYQTVNFKHFFEPTGEIRSVEEFIRELKLWSRQQAREMEILDSSMEPRILLEGKHFLCRLAAPTLSRYNRALSRSLNHHGINETVGTLRGFKWVYLYEI